MEKRRAFLESKNLTAEEIQLALARASEEPAPSPAGNYGYSAQARAPPPGGYGYGYGYQGYPQQWAPPTAPVEPPRRDWRDWFIMATVTTGVSYGLYTLAKVRFHIPSVSLKANPCLFAQRYVTPLIAPPTPPQLEQDKTSIDESFARAFALIDQLSSDTATLKEAETQRNTRLDSAIADIETVLAELKQANADREKQARRTIDDIAALRERIPTALQGWKAEHERRLAEVSQELRSLKMLVGNRVGVSVGLGSTASIASPAAPKASGAGVGGAMASAGGNVNGEMLASDAAKDTPTLNDMATSPGASDTIAPATFVGPNGQPGFSFEGPKTSAGAAAGKRAIPAWQLAASAASSDDAAQSGNGA